MARVSTRKSKAKKNVMGRLAALSMAQRQDVALLVGQGIPEAEARAIAQGYAAAKSDVAKAAPTTPEYYEAFHAASRRMLPDWQHRMLHQSARGKAGAAGRQRSRMREDDVKGALLAEMEALQKRMRFLQEEVGKASPLASEVHVPVPLGSSKKKRETVIKSNFDESQHPRADNGQFGEGSGSGTSGGGHEKGGGGSSANPPNPGGGGGGSGGGNKSTGSKVPFESMGSAEHMAAAKVASKTAVKYADAGKTDLANKHLEKAGAHTQAAKAHREAAAQAEPMTSARYGEVYGKVADAYSRGGNAAGHAALASLPMHEREQLSQVQRGITRLERSEDRGSRTQKSVLKSMSQKELAYVQAAYGLQQPLESAALEAGMVPPEADALVQANRLVAGMDAELAGGASDAEDARRRASRNLMERPGLYDSVGATTETRGMHGLLLDVGSGANRAQGYLGLDLYPHDHGTVLHDVELGLPFPDGSVRAIRLHHSLHEILDAPGANPDPTRLLTECQRVLREGGCLYYAGPEPLIEEAQRWAMPGLVLLHQNRDGTEQVLRRVPLRYPAYHGADADFSPGPELPLDVQMALTAANTSRAERAMANLIHKSEPRMVPIIKADKMRQIVTGVVLEPHSEDLQGDWMTPEDIERAAHGYLIGSRIVGSEHGRPIDANVVESYITPQDLTFATAAGTELVPQGSWVMSVKITSPEEWQQVLAGDYGGFSVGGYGAREEAA